MALVLTPIIAETKKCYNFFVSKWLESYLPNFIKTSLFWEHFMMEIISEANCLDF